tara:strand:+ start:619390 stop:620250 length:861 start_codon:yes stop_codon:yes gene_type:complete
MSWVRALLVGLVVLLVGGCGEDAPVVVDDGAGFVSEITEPMTGAGLRVGLDATSVELTERVVVRAELTWGDGVHVELIEPDWVGAGWNGVVVEPGEVRFDGAGYVQETVFLLEPFLGWEYEVPSIGIRASSEEAGKRIARLEPIPVEVTSVLGESDGVELAPAIGLAAMEPIDEESGVNLGVWIGLGVTLVSVFVVLILARHDGDEEEEVDPETVLMVASQTDELSSEDLGALHRAMVVLGREHEGIRVISHEVERARFSGGAVDHGKIQAAAKRAVELCGLRAQA